MAIKTSAVTSNLVFLRLAELTVGDRPLDHEYSDYIVQDLANASYLYQIEVQNP